MGGKGGSETTTLRNVTDPRDRSFAEQLRAANLSFFGGGASPFSQQAGAGFQQLAGGIPGATGLQGIEAFESPHTEGVIGAIQQAADRQRALTGQRADDLATRAGAFGGSRGEIARQAGIRGVNQAELQAVSGARERGFEAAANRLLAERGRQSQLGLQGLFGLRGVGSDESQRQLAALQGLGGLVNPFGPSEQIQTTQKQGSLFGSLLGAGLIGAGTFLGGPAGGAAAANVAGSGGGGGGFK
jgi:hypothetical protein